MKKCVLYTILPTMLALGLIHALPASSDWVETDLHGPVYAPYFPWVYAHGDWMYMTGDSPNDWDANWTFLFDKGWYRANDTAFGPMVYTTLPGELGILDGPSFKNLLHGHPITLPSLDLFPASVIGDPYFIEAVAIADGELRLQVSYGGGCLPHIFFLVTDNQVMESNPPRVRFFISHNANDDLCEALIEEDLRYDLTYFMGLWKTYGSPIIFEINTGRPWGEVTVEWTFEVD